MNHNYLQYLAKNASVNIHPKGRMATELLIQHLNIQNGQNILELGCGTGETLVRIRSKGKISLTGLDILPEMIQMAKTRLKFVGLRDIRVIGLDEKKGFPFTDEAFDSIYCESVLGIQDSESLTFLLREIYRTLKKGGRFIANEAIWRESITTEMVEKINAQCITDFGLRQSSKEALHLKDWIMLFNKTGFTTHSSNLLESHKLRSIDSVRNTKTLLSIFFSWYRKAINLFNIDFHRNRLYYSKTLKKHEEDRLCIEHRFFVLTK